MYQPLVSIIMNCYNSETYLKEAIQSILSQTYENFEIIFWDNCSEDSSALIVKGFSDERIKYFLAPKHTKLGEARLCATENASGELLAFLDCDDEWFPHKLAKQVSVMRNPRYGFCYAGHVQRDHNGKFLQNWVHPPKAGYIFPDLVKSFNVDMVTPVIRTSLIKRLNIRFNPNIFASEEMNFFLRLSLHSEALVLGDALGVSRRLPNSLTRTSGDKIFRDLELTIEQLLEENETIEEKFPREISYLKFKALYHQVKWLMDKNNTDEAKNIMRRASFDFVSFKLLKILILTPVMWKVVHHCIYRVPSLKNTSYFRRLIGF